MGDAFGLGLALAVISVVGLLALFPTRDKLYSFRRRITRPE